MSDDFLTRVNSFLFLWMIWISFVSFLISFKRSFTSFLLSPCCAKTLWIMMMMVTHIITLHQPQFLPGAFSPPLVNYRIFCFDKFIRLFGWLSSSSYIPFHFITDDGGLTKKERNMAPKTTALWMWNRHVMRKLVP